jgi:carboxyl-terminal processing protease
MTMRRRLTSLLAVAVLALATAAPAAAQNLTSCTTVSQNLFVRDVLADLYYWNTEIPAVNAAQFRSPEAYLDRVRYRPLDEHFSYIGSRAEADAYYSDSQFIGFGFSMQLEDEGLRISQVFPDSPAAEADLLRGEVIVAIGGRAVSDLVLEGQLDAALGPAQEGIGIDIQVRRGDQLREARMVKRPVTIPTVSHLSLYQVDGRRVGYLFFRNFVTPSLDALTGAFAALRGEGVTELVLDLRYNGGGLVTVARHLASLIGGTRTDGQVLAEYFHNERNAFRNEVMRFEPREQALQLERLVVVTTRASASASELVVNALRPFMPVVTVGEATYGKPVGQYGINFCDKVLYPVAFTLRNALGQGDYFGGIPADCQAADDLTRQIADPDEASLQEALHVVRTGRCSAPPLLEGAPARRRASVDTAPRATGLRALINAY